MKAANRSFIIPPIGDNPEQVSHYSFSAPWKNEEVCFNIANSGYPTPHTHEYYELLVILSGSVVHQINGTQYVMHRGDCCFIRPDDCHYTESLPQSETQKPYLSVNFLCKPEFIRKIICTYSANCLSLLENTKEPLSFYVSNATVTKIEKTCLYIQTPSGSPSETNVLICKALVTELISECILSQFGQTHSNYPEWLKNFILVLQNPANFSKKMSELTEGIPYSYSYIQKQFKQHLGTSIISYINSVKLSCAKDLLMSTQMTILDITNYLGFDSVSHLNHLFKKAYGISPMTLRNQSKT